jgi:hypothetical protein
MKNPDHINALDSLFHRWPALLGFTVQDASSVPGEREWIRLNGGLSLADVGLQDWVGHEDRMEILEELAGALLELMEERPEAHELLCGRTFARTLH